MRIHLDTDLGGDADDLCALAMLLGDPGVELTGITTCAEEDGRRADMVRYALRLAGRTDIPVEAGAEATLDPNPGSWGFQDMRYWPDLPAGKQAASGRAAELIAASAAMDATLVAIGPYTNLALLELQRPGALGRAEVVVMGGYLGPLPEGLPDWGPNMDFNVQADRAAARLVFERLNPLIVPLQPCFHVGLLSRHLPVLRAGGPLARLIADQAELHSMDHHMEALSSEFSGLPDGLLNFQWDPVACAAALGWESVMVSHMRLRGVAHEGHVVLRPSDAAPLRRVVADVDAEAFNAEWLARVCRT
jgi:purine nucleosidase